MKCHMRSRLTSSRARRTPIAHNIKYVHHIGKINNVLGLFKNLVFTFAFAAAYHASN